MTKQKLLDKKKTKELDWVEPLWDIIGEVKIPSTLKGHDELSLFDVCMRGNEDEEGIWLAKKLEKFIQSLLTQQRTELLEEIMKIIEVNVHVGSGYTDECDKNQLIEEIKKL